jgi:MFS transporter, putative metabolite:H+ symporter
MRESPRGFGVSTPDDSSPGGSSPDRRYLRLLLLLLATATFFEGYDGAIAGVVLNDLSKEFHVGTGELSWVILVVGSGAFGALFVTGLGDRFGRRPVLIGTTLGYAVFTGLTATAANPLVFVVYQFLARVFLVSELGLALTMVAEEFPPERRARAVAILTAFGGLGIVVLAVLYRLPIFAPTGLGWRGLYLVGVIPLLLVGLLRFKLRETDAWLEVRSEGAVPERVPFGAVLTGPYRREALLVSAVYFFAHVGMIAGIAWFPLFAQQERGFSAGDVSTFLSIGFPLGITGYFVAGWLLDKIGRRATGVLFMLIGMVCGIGLYQVTGKELMFVFLVLSVFFGLGVTPILGAIVPELFPTEIRATAVAMARSIFGTLGATLGPFVAGQLGDRTYGPAGSLANGVSLMILAYLPAALLLLKLPETRGRVLLHMDLLPPHAHADEPAATPGGIPGAGGS